MLKEIPRGTTFILRIVEPLKAGFGKALCWRLGFVTMVGRRLRICKSGRFTTTIGEVWGFVQAFAGVGDSVQRSGGGGLGEVVCRGGLLGLGIHYGWLGIRKAVCAGGGSSTAVGGGLGIIGGHRHRPLCRRCPTSDIDIDISYSAIGTKHVGLNPFIPISEVFRYQH